MRSEKRSNRRTVFLLRMILILSIFLTTLSSSPLSARASDLPPSDLALPQVVASGDEVSFVLNESRFLFFAAPVPGESIRFSGDREGVSAWRDPQGGLAGGIRLAPGHWNLTFESAGRIALGFVLGDRCPIPAAAEFEREGGFTCPPIFLSEPTAFGLVSLSSTMPYRYRVEGDVDSFYYDDFLQPAGRGPAIRLQGAEGGLFVLIPRAGAAEVTISASLVRTSIEAWYGFVAASATIAVLGVVGLILLRRRR